MSKFEQELINDITMGAYKCAMEEFHKGVNTDYVRLANCQAWEIETEHYILLKSYNTIVAVYSKKSGWLYDVLRLVYGYTHTSAQHIYKFKMRCNVSDSDVYVGRKVEQ